MELFSKAQNQILSMKRGPTLMMLYDYVKSASKNKINAINTKRHSFPLTILNPLELCDRSQNLINGLEFNRLVSCLASDRLTHLEFGLNQFQMISSQVKIWNSV
ncbi:hypothetical protein BpHYR1_054547 [Brachionus plicatilis]|uniref:Uncharacterized protein n=1 Tax=Brachionus plicatilis TaxID=10195 RepID=A0A3M7SEQ5_BRAPC|nr:hypothetical protein BpHYR1_054547 [Brachionus plicatilis]